MFLCYWCDYRILIIHFYIIMSMLAHTPVVLLMYLPTSICRSYSNVGCGLYS